MVLLPIATCFYGSSKYYNSWCDLCFSFLSTYLYLFYFLRNFWDLLFTLYKIYRFHLSL